MLRFSLFLVLSFLAFLAVATSVEAASPPTALVMETRNVSCGELNCAQDMNVTWRVSADDPDQVNGSLQYTLYVRCPSISSGYVRLNLTDSPISARSGWLQRSTPLTLGTPFCGLEKMDFNMTVWQGGAESESGCRVNLSAVRVAHKPNLFGFTGLEDDGHAQCGTPQIFAPSGVVAFVNRTANESSAGFVDVRYTTSLDDPTANASGSFDYRIFRADVFSDSEETRFLSLGLDPTTAEDASGIRFNRSFFYGSEPFLASFLVRAEDPLTRQWADVSCTAQVNVGHKYESNGCGNISVPAIIGVGPTFPLVDVAAWAGAAGMSLDSAGWLLGAVLVLGITIGGMAVAGVVGGILASVLATATVGVLGLVPLWFIVVLFVVSAAAAVFLSRGGGSS